MSTAVLTSPARARGADTRPGLGRLTLVELRKMTDTRSGFWLLFTTAALTAAVVVISCLVFPDEDSNLFNYFVMAVQPASLLLPIVGILLVSSEWTQRTAMITFTLVPHRSRVLTAKLLAGLALAAIAFLICLIVALAATACFGADGDATWSLSAGLFGQVAFTLGVSMLIGVGFGAVLLSSAPAIVLYFVLPTAFAALGAISALEGAARWLDQSRTMAPMLEETLSATQWARVATSLALWMAVPIALGFWRVVRSDVR